jgi:hypothetical protein
VRFARHLTTTVPAFVGTALVVLLLSVAPTLAATVHSQDEDDVGLNVEVISSSPTSSATGTPMPSGSATPTTAASPTSTTTTSTTPTSTTNGPAPTGAQPGGSPSPSTVVNPGEEQDIGGVLYVSALAWSYSPSFNPLDGSADLHFTVRNVYPGEVTGSARFWVTGPFGVAVGQPVEVPVAAIKPGETRFVTARISGLAQWTVVTASATFTPPAALGELKLTPLTRTSLVWYLSWFVLLLLAMVATWLVDRRRRQLRRAAHAGADEEAAE